MTQKVLKVGTSAGMTISKESLKELGIKIGDSIVVETDGRRKRLIVEPARSRAAKTENAEVLAWTDSFIKRYRPALEALAKK